MSSFDDSFIQPGDDDWVGVDSVPVTESTQPFDYDEDKDSYVGYNNNNDEDDVSVSQPSNGNGSGGSDGPILPPPSEMQAEEGFALREWRRVNAIKLEEKEKREKELLSQIIDEADEYKVEFYRKREITCENNKAMNREKEKLFVSNQEKFYAEADKNYWKSIAELIPNEVPSIEKKRGKKKDDEKKPSIVVIQGPKPGKPAELSRMRQILIKLKHNTPSHLKLSPPPATASSTDTKTAGTSAVVIPPEPVVAN